MNCKPLFMFKSSIAALRNSVSFFVCLKDVDDAFISVHGNFCIGCGGVGWANNGI